MSLTEAGHFTEPALLIMASLADGPKHGYAMIEDIIGIAGVRLVPGTLYGALARLEEQGLIAPLPTEERRRPYRLTPAGEEALRAQLQSMAAFAGAALKRLTAP